MSLASLNSRIAVACRSVKFSFDASSFDFFDLKVMSSVAPVIRQFFAVSRRLDPLMISMIRSMISTARIRPSWTSRFSVSFARRFVYFRVLISFWNFREASRICFNPRTSGLPSAMQSMLTPKVSSNFVFL